MYARSAFALVPPTPLWLENAPLAKRPHDVSGQQVDDAVAATTKRIMTTTTAVQRRDGSVEWAPVARVEWAPVAVVEWAPVATVAWAPVKHESDKPKRDATVVAATKRTRPEQRIYNELASAKRALARVGGDSPTLLAEVKRRQEALDEFNRLARQLKERKRREMGKAYRMADCHGELIHLTAEVCQRFHLQPLSRRTTINSRL